LANGYRCLSFRIDFIFRTECRKRKRIMEYTNKNITAIVDGKVLQLNQEMRVEHLLIDSRKVYSSSTSLFFALKGSRRDGHQFIPELYKRGVKNFIISDAVDVSDFPEANFILVTDTLEALQRLAG